MQLIKKFDQKPKFKGLFTIEIKKTKIYAIKSLTFWDLY